MKKLIIALLLLPTITFAMPTDKEKNEAYLQGCKIGLERLAKDFKGYKEPECKDFLDAALNDVSVKKKWDKETNIKMFKFHGCFIATWLTIIQNSLGEMPQSFPNIKKYCGEFKPEKDMK